MSTTTKATTKRTRPASRKGRKSASQNSAETMRPKASTHLPPEVLTDRGKAIWCGVVDSLPDDHFYPSDLQLLAEYCQTADLIERIRLRWDGMPTLIKSNGDEVVHPVLTAMTRNQSTLAALAGKLRICPSARMSSSKAGHERPRRKSKREGLMN